MKSDHVHIHFRDRARWTSGGGTHVRGEAHTAEGTLVAGESLHRRVQDASSAEAFAETLRSLNGSVAAVSWAGSALRVGVDRIRSLPLFYATVGARLYVSDDALWVRRQAGDAAFDPAAEAEFLRAGYVTGGDTLYPNVKQLQAGEALIAETAGGQISAERRRYYRFTHGNYFAADEEQLFERLDAALVAAFERLLDFAGGREIVLPLSGGYDSRLIAVMLRRLGAERVHCFSYGKPGNREAAVSRKVAGALGYPWHFVPYSRRRWYDWYRTAERRRYFDYASGLCTLAHVQDWPAVWTLKQRGALSPDAVFVPGHSGQVAGRQVPRRYAERAVVGRETLAEDIRCRHYSLWGRPLDAPAEAVLSRDTTALIDRFDVRTPDGAGNAFEQWEWQERHAKFIINSVRAYEFWGYGWRLPLWDHALMDFWERVPLSIRAGGALYVSFLMERLFPAYGVAYPKKQPRRSWRHYRNRLTDPWYGKFNGHLPYPLAWLCRSGIAALYRHPLVQPNRPLYLANKNGLNALFQLSETAASVAAEEATASLGGSPR